MKKYVHIFVLGMVLALLGASCEDFLSKSPTKGTNQPITTVDQLEQLLNNPTTTNTGINYAAANYTAAYSTDDTDIPLTLYDPWTSKFQVTNLYYYTFNTNDIPNEASDALWIALYSNIYKANLIIEYVDKVSGDAVLKARVKAEAYFLRAYSNWILANYYCLPYSAANLTEPGLPRKVETSMEADLTRMSLKETYELIEADLEAALKVDKESTEYTWRANKATVNAFLSRYYLHKGEYDKAIVAADFALTHKGIAKLKNYNTLVAGTPVSYTNPAISLNYCETNNYTAAQYAGWEEFFYVRMEYVGTQWFLPGKSLVDLYDQTNDKRFQWFFLNGNRRFSITSVEALRYTVFSDGRYIPSGPTVQEVMLNKAECLLRKSSPDIPGSLALANELRNNRLAPGAPGIHLTAATKEEALQKVLQERRREMPFAARWLDIRRFAVNETPSDDVVVTRTFHPVANGVVDMTKTEVYTLPVGSRRYALPLNGVEIDASRGQLQQNTYTK